MLPQRQSLRDAVQVTLVDLHLRKGLPPQTKYNAAQRIAYSSCVVMGAMMLLTGFAIYKPTQAHWLTTLCGGYEMARWLHFWTTMAFLGFFGVHVMQVILAGWNNFRAMVSGREVTRVGSTVDRSGTKELAMSGEQHDETQVTSGAPMQAETSGAADGPEETAQAEKPVAVSAQPADEPPAVLAGEQRPVDPEAADDVLTKQVPLQAEADAAVLAASRRYTRRAFAVAGVAAAAGYGLFHSLGDGPSDEGTDNFLRKTLRFNADVSKTAFRDHALAPTYPLRRAETLRVNGVYGLKKALQAEHWRLQLVGMKDAQRDPRYTKDVTAWKYLYTGETEGDQGHDTKVDPNKEAAQHTAMKMAPEPMQAKAMADEGKGDDDDNEPDANGTGRTSRGNEEAGESDSTLKPHTPGLLLQLPDITRLPRHELVTQFKCIEGWSQIVHWAGVRMADFLDLYPPALIDGKDPRYVYMETPDGDYYTGYDMHAMRHPQTLLVTEMMGEPLTQFHGAPLRLHMPTKYGYKQIKRIGLIAYTNDRPDDYWTKLGYDWYAGL